MYPIGVHSIGVYPVGVDLTGMYLKGVHLLGVHLIGGHLIGGHLMGVYLTDTPTLLVRILYACILCGCGSRAAPAEIATEIAALIILPRPHYLPLTPRSLDNHV
jgi:hypothetical protein